MEDYKKDTLNAILNRLSESSIEDLVSKSDIPDSVLKAVGSFTDKQFNYSVYETISENVNVSAETLELMAKSIHEFPRYAVAESSKTPLSLLETLSKDDISGIRLAVAENPNVSMKILKKLSNDESSKIREKVTEALIEKREEAPLDNFMKLYESSKQDVVVVLKRKNIGEDLEEAVKEVLNRNLPYLNIRVEENSRGSMAFVMFNNKSELHEYSDFKTPKEAIESYLLNESFNKKSTKQEDLKSIEKSIENIENKFISKILKGTSFTYVDDLLYFQPMTDWKKSEINETVKNAKKVKADFEKIDEFLDIEYGDDGYSDAVYFDLENEINLNNNLIGAGNCIESLSITLTLAKEQLKEINNVLETTKGDDSNAVVDEAENTTKRKVFKQR